MMWENLASVLLLSGQSAKAELDWEKVVSCFNVLIATASKGNENAPKELTAGEFRKAALMATRLRLKNGSRQLAAAKTEEEKVAAKAIRSQALAVLKRQGWKSKPVKRAVKEKGTESDSGKKNGEADHGRNSEAGKLAEGGHIESQQLAPVTPAPTPPAQPQTPPADKGSPQIGRFYLTGKTFPVLGDIKKAGGRFDSKLKQWWLPDAVTRAEAQKLVDDQDNSSKKVTKQPSK